MEFRESTIQSFSIVFDSEDAEEGKEVKTVTNDFASNWSWFGVIYKLTGGEIINLSKITNTSLYECLTWLTYEAELEEQKNNIL